MKNPFGLLLSVFCCLLPFISIAQKKYEVEKLNSSINSNAYDEITPVASLDGNTLYFTRVGYPDYIKSLVEDGVEMSSKLGEAEFRSYLANIYTRMGQSRVTDPSRSESYRAPSKRRGARSTGRKRRRRRPADRMTSRLFGDYRCGTKS